MGDLSEGALATKQAELPLFRKTETTRFSDRIEPVYLDLLNRQVKCPSPVCQGKTVTDPVKNRLSRPRIERKTDVNDCHSERRMIAEDALWRRGTP